MALTRKCTSVVAADPAALATALQSFLNTSVSRVEELEIAADGTDVFAIVVYWAP